MKKLVAIPVLFLLVVFTIFVSPPSVSSQQCIPDYQSCDWDNPCCNHPDTQCIEGSCQPASENGEDGGDGTTVLCRDEKSINTAIGCIPVQDTNEFIGFILKWAIGIGGGIAFLLIIFAGFQIMTSAGNPERLQAGRELLTSAIAGLILLVFSVFILRIIGVDILQLPGFGN